MDLTVGTPPYMSPEQCLGHVVNAASDVYSLGCLLCELLTGDVPFLATTSMPLRAQHVQSPPPSLRARRRDVPAALDTLVSSMLAKDSQARPSAETVYGTLLPYARTSGGTSGDGSSADDESRDPTRPFRRPLLGLARRRKQSTTQARLTDAETEQLRAEAEALLDEDRPSEAIALLEDGVARAAHDAFLELRLRHFLAAALFYADEYTRAASLFDVVGRDYRRRLPPNDQLVLDCAYHAGHAYAEIGNPEKALAHLRFFVQNAHASAGDDTADQIREARFVIAQMLMSSGHADEALLELDAIRPLLVEAFGADSTQVRNLDKQINRLRSL